MRRRELLTSPRRGIIFSCIFYIAKIQPSNEIHSNKWYTNIKLSIERSYTEMLGNGGCTDKTSRICAINSKLNVAKENA